MKRAIHRRTFLKQASSVALALPTALNAADGAPPPPPAEPTIVRTRELMVREPNPGTTSSHVWLLHLSTTSRTNLVEMSGEASEHIHPDAEHSLYVISGEVMVRAGDLKTTLRSGDYISIPAGMKHGYSVPQEKRALLISMDAPPYNPRKTIRPKDSAR